jgi:hypothetical protein
MRLGSGGGGIYGKLLVFGGFGIKFGGLGGILFGSLLFPGKVKRFAIELLGF